MRFPMEDRYRPGLVFAIALGAAGAAAIAIALATGRFEDETDPTAGSAESAPNVSAPAPPVGGDGGDGGTPTEHDLLTFEPGTEVAVLETPNGERLGSVGDVTAFGNPSALSVGERRGAWLGVESEFAANRPLAWIQRDAGLVEESTPYSMQADLIARELELLRGRRIVETMAITIGTPETSLPAGRFAVSDRIEEGISPALGAGALALTAVTADLPPDWPFGDRVAIRGGEESEGGPDASLRVSNADMRTLLERVPLGAPVFVVR